MDVIDFLDGPDEKEIGQPKRIEICIRNYEKRGEGLNSYIVYVIQTKVFEIPGYTKNYFEVSRRFSDFLGLREKLAFKFLNKGIIIPYAPEKSLSTLTKTKLGEENTANELAEKRSQLLQRFIRRVVSHPRLAIDCDVRDFLSFDGPLPKAAFTSAFSGSNVKKMFKSVGDAFSKLAFPMDENDRWFEQVNNQVDEMDEVLGHLYNQFENLSNHRKDLASNGESLCKAMSILASCEENTVLARSLCKLAETHENFGIVGKDQSKADYDLLVEEFHEQLQLVNVLKEVLYERVKSWQNWQNQQQVLAKKREVKAKMDLALRTDPKKSESYKCEVKEQENKTDKLENQFLEMSKNIRDEYSRYCLQRRKDITNALVEYFESLLKFEQRSLNHWEKFEQDIKSLNY